MSENTAVALTPKEARLAILTTLSEKYEGEIASLAPKGMEPAHYFASLRLYIASHPELLKCTPESVAQGILRVAQTGLTLGESCDLLPFKDRCQFSPRYNGIVQLAISAGTRAINAGVVRMGEDFRLVKGTNPKLEHHPVNDPAAKILGAYAIAELRPGSFVFEYVSQAEIDAVRKKYSKSWWWRDPRAKTAVIPLEEIPWYGKKTAIRKLSPLLPKNARLAFALMYAEQLERVPDEDADYTIEDDASLAADGEAEGAAVAGGST